VPILPLPFPGGSTIGISGTGSIPDGGGGVPGGGDGMGRDMGGCHCMACGTGGRTGRIILSNITGSCMSCK
jgi:hypothetical protein